MDPGVAVLKEVFSDIPEDTLSLILQQEGGNVERATNVLLAMADPGGGTPVADPFAGADNEQQQVLATVDDEETARKMALDMQDEEFARQLQAEEDAQAREIAYRQQQAFLAQQQAQQQQAAKQTSGPSGGNVLNKIGAGLGGLFKKKEVKPATGSAPGSAGYSVLSDEHEEEAPLERRRTPSNTPAAQHPSQTSEASAGDIAAPLNPGDPPPQRPPQGSLLD